MSNVKLESALLTDRERCVDYSLFLFYPNPPKLCLETTAFSSTADSYYVSWNSNRFRSDNLVPGGEARAGTFHVSRSLFFSFRGGEALSTLVTSLFHMCIHVPVGRRGLYSAYIPLLIAMMHFSEHSLQRAKERVVCFFWTAR